MMDGGEYSKAYLLNMKNDAIEIIDSDSEQSTDHSTVLNTNESERGPSMSVGNRKPIVKIEISDSEDETEEHGSKSDGKVKVDEAAGKERGDRRSDIKLSPSKSPRNYETTLERAVREIRKGGSLLLISNNYGIPENVLFEKLVSKRLPDVSTLLSTNEEDDLVRWILRSNQYNHLVLKNQLMERVGKLKRITRITPIFHKSKYGRLWYYHFLSAHPEIYENDGVLLQCETFQVKRSNRRTIKKKNDSSEDSDGTVDEGEKDNNSCSDESSGTNERKKFKDVPIKHEIKDAVVVLEKLPNPPPCGNGYELSFLNDNYTTTFPPGNSYKEEPPCEDSKYIEYSETIKPNTLYAKYFMKRVQKAHGPACTVCGRAYSSQRKVKQHILNVHHGCQARCGKFKKHLKSEIRLKVHLKLAHSSMRYKCDKCFKVFKRQSSLRHHKVNRCDRKALVAARFICDICTKGFKHKKSMEEHIRYGHMKENKKHKCEICNKSFVKNSHLLRHKIRHTKENAFQCYHCSKHFSRKYLLVDHIRNCSQYKENQLEIRSKLISKEYLNSLSLE